MTKCKRDIYLEKKKGERGQRERERKKLMFEVCI
jgi:hypothetical protein